MNLTADLVPIWLNLAAWPVLAVIVGWNLLGAPWNLLQRNGLHPLYSLSVVLLAGLWWLRVGAYPGLEFHLLGITTLLLVFGWRLTLVAGAVALVMTSLLGGSDWRALGINGLLVVVLPVALGVWLHRLIYRRLPRHFFVYVLVTAHFASMLVIAAVILSGALLLGLLGAHPWGRIGSDYLVFLPLVLLPEGFVNGALMTLLVILRPEWVRSFDDRDYIDGK
jgi:uncharacterized membrane protein